MILYALERTPVGVCDALRKVFKTNHGLKSIKTFCINHCITSIYESWDSVVTIEKAKRKIFEHINKIN